MGFSCDVVVGIFRCGLWWFGGSGLLPRFVVVIWSRGLVVVICS